MEQQDAAALAEVIWKAKRDGTTLSPLTEQTDLSLTEAYAVQAEFQRRREAAGQRRIGYKLGYTSEAMRKQMGVDTMNFGPVTDAMLMSTGEHVGEGLLQPRVEPEVALVFGDDVSRARDVEEVLAAVASVRAALEVVDSVWTGYRFRIEDNTADGSSAARVVLGPRLGASNLAAVTVVLELNGIETERGSGADASGHPAAGVVWLLDQLATLNEQIHAGEIVLTGGLTSAVPLQPGDVIRGVFDSDADVTVCR